MTKNAAYGLASGLLGIFTIALLGDTVHRKLNRSGDDANTIEPIYDNNGYDAEGYSKDGFNADGFDHSGYNRQGYDVDGFDRSGYNRQGYDSNGFNRFGYGRDGFNLDGLDRYGYGRNRYNLDGIDRAGHTWQFYVDHLGRLYLRLNEARTQLDAGNYRYAVHDARVVLEEALRTVVAHALGPTSVGDSILNNLRICKDKKILCSEEDIIRRLHDVRMICNGTGHELDYSDNLTRERVHFVIAQVRNFLKQAEPFLIPNVQDIA